MAAQPAGFKSHPPAVAARGGGLASERCRHRMFRSHPRDGVSLKLSTPLSASASQHPRWSRNSNDAFRMPGWHIRHLDSTGRSLKNLCCALGDLTASNPVGAT